MRRTLYAPLVSLLLLGVASSSDAARPVPGTKAILPFERFTLPNGLEVLVHEDHTTPIVAIDVSYHVGSKDEAPGKTGYAHLFEHLMFKGSRNVADGQHFQSIIEAGGTCNATTNRDRTHYFETVPSSYLSRVLFLEADRMAHLLDGLTQRSLANQRDVVRNERRQNYENRPYGVAVRALAEALYPTGHPYHWLTIGDHADLERASLADIQAFFRRYYRPGNATLAIAGDVDLATAKKLATEHFGGIPSDPEHPDRTSSTRTERPAPLPIVTLAADKDLDLDDAVSLERLTLAWPSPAAMQPGDAELDLLSYLLGPSSGRLHRKLVHELQIAQSVSVGQQSSLLASHFEVTVMLKPGHTSAEVQKVVDDELDNIRSGKLPITKDELASALTQVQAGTFFDLMSLIQRCGRLLQYDYVAKDPGFLERDLARYRAVTPDSVRASLRALGTSRVRMIVHPRKPAHAEVSR
ncbi:MAG: pitrilysin family protein [Polyangia bacterium]